MVEKPDFLPFESLPLDRGQALQAGIYLCRLEEERETGFEYGELGFILAGNCPEAERIKNAVGRTMSVVAGPVTRKQRKNIVDHLIRRGEELNLL